MVSSKKLSLQENFIEPHGAEPKEKTIIRDLRRKIFVSSSRRNFKSLEMSWNENKLNLEVVNI